MEYCKYHPLIPATYACNYCDTQNCDQCIDEPSHRGEERCFICEREAISLGASYSAEPFWRRLQESFRYPLNTQTIILIIGVSFLSTILSFIPLTLIWYLIVTGAFMKFCFTCLENTAQGSLVPPDITAAYEGGLSLALQLLAFLAAIAGTVIGAYMLAGQGLASLVGVLFICALPAMLINFAMDESLFSALNPLKAISLIAAIGLPYGLLLALIMIMLGSVGVISELIGQDFSLLTLSLQSAVSNYYMIVVFHIMGYMIFQYQGVLGFVAREDFGGIKQVRSDIDKLLSKIDIMVKEGDYEKAIHLFQDGVKKYPNDKAIYTQCFEFLVATKSIQYLNDFAPHYFQFLSDTHREDQLSISYKKIMQINPAYMPEKPALRHILAKVCRQKGDSRSAIKLLNGLHKLYPDYNRLIEAYKLLENALRDLPNMATKADQCAKLIKQLERIKPTTVKNTLSKSQKPISPTISDYSLPVKDTQRSENPPQQSDDNNQGDLPPIEFK